MARRLGETPLRELLPGSIADDPTIRAAAEALDAVPALWSPWPCCRP